MDAIHVLRGSSVAARARWAMTIAAAAAFSAAVVAVVTFGAHAVHASPPTGRDVGSDRPCGGRYLARQGSFFALRAGGVRRADGSPH